MATHVCQSEVRVFGHTGKKSNTDKVLSTHLFHHFLDIELAAPQSLECLLHHLVLLNKKPDILLGCPGTNSNPLDTAAAYYLWLFQLLLCHTIHNDLKFFKGTLGRLELFIRKVSSLWKHGHVRKHLHDLLYRTHLIHCPKLFIHILEREFAPHHTIYIELILIDDFLGPLDKGLDIPHSKQPGYEPVSLKFLKILWSLPYADKSDRRSGL